MASRKQKNLAALKRVERKEACRASVPLHLENAALSSGYVGAIRHQTPGGRKFNQGLRAPSIRPSAGGGTVAGLDTHQGVPRTRTAVQSNGWRERSVPCNWDKLHRHRERRPVPALATPPEPRPLKPSITVVRRRPVVVTVPRVKEEVPA